ncbi:MAG: hypothetical protein Q7W30_00370 [Coriobacteriia bacterium]|nr:hypothetical protein [Coriobacteriia bacterium]
MTKKHGVNLETYRKADRHLSKDLLNQLQGTGMLHPILEAVSGDDALRFDIRERRFNVYYQGGSLLMVDGRKSPVALHFDPKYFKGNATTAPELPASLSSRADAEAWVSAFGGLKRGMDEWWKTHKKGERAHCQAMAAANSGARGNPVGDFLILDMEYQWAQRRLDLIAAQRSPSASDPDGWREPRLVFIEVKSEYSACTGASGLHDHARDFRDIIGARGGQAVEAIKLEYQRIWEQKSDLDLLDSSVPFERFSTETPALLLVFVDLDVRHRSLGVPLRQVAETAAETPGVEIRLLKLNSPDYVMRDTNCVDARVYAGTASQRP